MNKIIEPLIINLLNEQPDDVLLGMEHWLLTQFSELQDFRSDHEQEYAQMKSLQPGQLIEETEEYQERVAVME